MPTWDDIMPFKMDFTIVDYGDHLAGISGIFYGINRHHFGTSQGRKKGGGKGTIPPTAAMGWGGDP